MNELEKKFEDYFYEIEKFSLRAERFYDDLAIPKMKEREKRMKQWMLAAFMAGAELKKKPLAPEEILDISEAIESGDYWHLRFGRAIERAHGIKE